MSNHSKTVQDRAMVTMAVFGGPIEVILVYRTVPLSMTLNDPKPRFQGQIILWCWISLKWLKIRPLLLRKAN